MSLNEKLQQLKAASLEKIPPETAAIMARTKADLKHSGILDKALGVGSIAPEFELPDLQGTSYNSAELLATGPLILTFYRGSW